MYFLNWQNKSVKFVTYDFFKKLWFCFDKIEEKWTDYYKNKTFLYELEIWCELVLQVFKKN